MSIKRICAGKEFQVKGADTEKAREEKFLVIPGGITFISRPNGVVPPTTSFFLDSRFEHDAGTYNLFVIFIIIHFITKGGSVAEWLA